MLSDSPPERDLEWSESGIEGAARFVQRVWKLGSSEQASTGSEETLDKKTHRAVAAVGEALEGLQFNKAVAQLYELVSAIEKANPSQSRSDAIRVLVQLVAPMAPHLAEESWDALGGEGLVAQAEWPVFDPAMLVDDRVTLAVQVNGKLRDTLTVSRGLGRDEAEALALASEKVRRQLDGAAPRKVIVVPDRLVNIVA
jgi:leucyl-tRNA synthetase